MTPRLSGSIRRRLVLQMLVVAAVLSGLLYVSVRTVADAAVETTQDSILGAATVAIAEELRGGDGGLVVNIPYAAFSMLAAVGEDRVFYRIVTGGNTVTGYDELPLADLPLTGLAPVYYTATYQDIPVRIGAVARSVLIDGKQVAVQVLVAQTRSAQAAISRQMANRAAALGLGFFVVAAVLSIFTSRSVLRPINSLAEAVARRGPQDLRPVVRAVPAEIGPLVGALNGLIARLSGSLSRTETFITEAAHHVRTPLATLRAKTEIALLRTEDDDTRSTLRGVIRAVDDAARSAGQLLEHATVVYRTDQRSEDELDVVAMVRDVAASQAPMADMRDIALRVQVPDAPIMLRFDPLLLESALRNLMDNAVKYSEPGGEVEVALNAQDSKILISVMDRGRGLLGVETSRLTRRFQRGENVGDVIGSGLGLTIVKEVARAQGGNFRLIEREGGGACAELIFLRG